MKTKQLVITNKRLWILLQLTLKEYGLKAERIEVKDDLDTYIVTFKEKGDGE